MSPAAIVNGAFWRDSKWLRETAFLALGLGLITGVVSLLLPKTYKSEARILPHASGSKASSLMGLAAASGFGDLFSGQMGGLENPVLTYPEILGSRHLRERVVLSEFPGSPGMSRGTVLRSLGVKAADRTGVDKAMRILADATKVDANLQSGVIAVSAITRDSVLAAFIVQRMLMELDRFNLESRSSRERATREFVEARKEEARQGLVHAEQALTSFRRTNLRIGNSPQLQLEQARLEREVETQSQLYSMLVREFEVARIEEKRDTPTFSVVDPATPPVRKHAPKVSFNVLVALIGAVGFRAVIAKLSRPAVGDG